jgi:acyl carrier protein phosphodiesterase
MNYLAHAFLSRATPELLTGGMLGDFVKGRIDDRYSAGVCAGIALHRAIDRYTDDHPVVQASRAHVAPERRRFAGILVDVFYDHFLALHWQRYSAVPLHRFTREVYAVLWPQRRTFPTRLQHMLPWMRAEDWLGGYAEVGAINTALRGIARRFRFAERARPLAEGVEDLLVHYDAFERQFHEFFPQLERYAALQGGSDAEAAPPTAIAG